MREVEKERALSEGMEEMRKTGGQREGGER